MRKFNTEDFMSPVKTKTWSNGRHQVHCVSVTPETHDVKTFSFHMPQPVLFLFKPGQFVTLELEIDGERVMRSYTISSSPSLPYRFSITVKKIPNGKVSTWLHENLQVGAQITLHGPVGQFNCLDYPASKVLLLSGGVGITPVMSMARWWFDTDANVDMVFAHSARTPKDIIYAAELEQMSARSELFTLHLICAAKDKGQAWGGYRGFISETMLSLIAPDYLEREVFCCGPDAYMQAVRNMLSNAGFDMKRYHEESFGTPPQDEPATLEDNQATTPINDQQGEILISIPKTNRQQRIAEGSTLIQAASQAGLNIPKACGQGICGTCRVKVLRGTDYEMNHNGGITTEEIEKGYVLSCCTKVYGDIEIEL